MIDNRFSKPVYLKTKPFLNRYKRRSHHQNIDVKELMKIMYNNHMRHPFSTLPYYAFGMNSIEAGHKLKSGNCIALSILFIEELAKNGIKSYLIPATVPKEYQVEDLFPISHVAVAIPVTESTFYIVDMAFYFKVPLYIDLKKDSEGRYIEKIPSASIYNNTERYVDVHYQGYVKTSFFNKWQKVKHDTIVVSCHYDDKLDDEWSYLITEVLNPDESIGNRYLEVKREPFITIIDENHNMLLYLKYNEWKPESNVPESIYCKYKDQQFNIRNENELPLHIRKEIKRLMVSHIL